MEIAIIVSSLSALAIAVCGVVSVKMRLDFLREQLRRAPDPSYAEVTELTGKVGARAADSMPVSVNGLARASQREAS